MAFRFDEDKYRWVPCTDEHEINAPIEELPYVLSLRYSGDQGIVKRSDSAKVMCFVHIIEDWKRSRSVSRMASVLYAVAKYAEYPIMIRSICRRGSRNHSIFHFAGGCSSARRMVR